MSISTGTRTTTPFIGDGSTTALAFTFKVFAAADIVLYQATAAGVQSTLALGVDYNVTLNPDQNNSPGGTVNMIVAPPLNYATVISSLVSMTQGVQLTNGGSFNPQVINDALDRLTILAQQNNLVDQLSVKIPQTDGLGLTTTLPTAALRALKTIVFDASGNIGVSVDSYVNQTAASAASAAAAAVSAAAALVSQNAAAGSATAAASSATAASTSASGAASSASAASTSASGASTSATAAAASASAASTSASGASTSATNAAASAATATTQAGIATTQATNSATSATASATSAAAALVSQNAAATSATNSSNSATASAASAAAAAASAGGFDLRASCNLVATSNQTGTYNNGASGVGATFTYTATGVNTIDSVSLTLGMSILLTGQSTSFQNGIYTVTTAGSVGVAGVLTRRTDYNTSAQVFQGTAAIVESGTIFTSTMWIMTTTGTITMGAGTMAFTQLNVAAPTVTLTGAVTGSGAGSFATAFGASPNMSGTLTLGASTASANQLAINTNVNGGLIINSSNTSGPAITLNSTSVGGKSFQFFSTGSANTPGWFGVYDATDINTIFALSGGVSGGAVNGTATSVFGFTSNNALAIGSADTGISRDSAGVIDIGTGAQGSKAGTINATTANFTGTATIGTVAATKSTANVFIDNNNAVTVASNAGTCSTSFQLNTFTNSSAATMAITLATAGAVDGQTMIVRVYDFSAVAQTIGWTNTENSTVSAPTTSNGSTTLPVTVGFIYNGSTSKWRCVAVA